MLDLEVIRSFRGTDGAKASSLEDISQGFDVMWNRAEINEKQALVFFIGGLEVEIKNLVKMFKPTALKQAYNLARLQDIILSYKHSHPNHAKYSPQTP